jgi:serine protease Do
MSKSLRNDESVEMMELIRNTRFYDFGMLYGWSNTLRVAYSGVVNAKSTSTSSGTSVEGIGFAIPINTATKVASELVNYGYVRGKVMLGINYVDVTSTYDAMRYGVNALGMYITAKYEGFEVADRVTAVDGKEVTYGADVKALLKNYKVGDELTITVVRKGQYVDVKVTLKEYVPDGVIADEEQTSRFESNFESQSARH